MEVNIHLFSHFRKFNIREVGRAPTMFVLPKFVVNILDTNGRGRPSPGRIFIQERFAERLIPASLVLFLVVAPGKKVSLLQVVMVRICRNYDASCLENIERGIGRGRKRN